jgi:hypothetical protein
LHQLLQNKVQTGWITGALHGRMLARPFEHAEKHNNKHALVPSRYLFIQPKMALVYGIGVRQLLRLWQGFSCWWLVLHLLGCAGHGAESMCWSTEAMLMMQAVPGAAGEFTCGLPQVRHRWSYLSMRPTGGSWCGAQRCGVGAVGAAGECAGGGG